ncbi:hypothetical protein HR060_14485 [Catenovulum sp. SM1970]|uniref:hypothetical protein n=1 Tax=Marinifaba aquimaris TaxID=2741323 RepID=UPI001573542E|nr:hypothetical protein [Marinifaba aquimaris]NTS78064.1 hypothetical protein [Marinifaba aquimaris]
MNAILEKLLFVIVTMTWAVSSWAHPGHDHHSFWSDFIHFAWLAPALIVVICLISLFRRTSSSKG